MTSLHWIDCTVTLVYFSFVLGIGVALKRYVKSSSDFFLSGRSLPAWVIGLAFISANLGAQEVIVPEGPTAGGLSIHRATVLYIWWHHVYSATP